jgi:hypothetical protein
MPARAVAAPLRRLVARFTAGFTRYLSTYALIHPPDAMRCIDRFLAARFTILAAIASASLALDTRRLDDGPPLFDFRFLMGSQRLRSLLLTHRNLLAQIS